MCSRPRKLLIFMTPGLTFTSVLGLYFHVLSVCGDTLCSFKKKIFFCSDYDTLVCYHALRIYFIITCRAQKHQKIFFFSFTLDYSFMRKEYIKKYVRRMENSLNDNLVKLELKNIISWIYIWTNIMDDV